MASFTNMATLSYNGSQINSNVVTGELQAAVCRPGGSTIQGVRLLEERAFRGAVTDAVLAAYEKTKDLGKK